jgi:DNA-binding CsgD family transcriptional regulator
MDEQTLIVVSDRIALLTSREREVLEKLAAGADVCAALSISNGTYKSHLSSAMTKLQVSTRGEAAALFLRWRLAIAIGACEAALEYAEDREDIDDGADGTPRANAAMQLATKLREAIAQARLR